jgi:hypothetical protein
MLFAFTKGNKTRSDLTNFLRLKSKTTAKTVLNKKLIQDNEELKQNI